ncbi:hypothetical protein EVAR_45599_1 [Eumeta japonica]|uniref:Uncharacterized protein n=1 Tax=Eumeta variegata TaxID=151549 RepID=A0A4C1YXE9_EUMVA|nr:hypothetical protein EVAR_45599_1 [Eumeta japonica]
MRPKVGAVYTVRPRIGVPSACPLLRKPHVKLVLNIEVKNPRCLSFLLTPQENRPPRRLKKKSEVQTYVAV